MAIVLIVEDHDDFRESLAEILHIDGWTALAAATVAEAWGIAQSVAVDVVLCDVFLPGTTGVDLKAKFQTDPKLLAIPFVFMTGHAPHVDELAPERVLLKPFAIETLGQMLVKAVSACYSTATKS